jgi:peroxiredoxin
LSALRSTSGSKSEFERCRNLGTEPSDFELRDASGQVVRLSEFRGRPVMPVFYPLDWSPSCSQQLDLCE